jgi:UrcA family protein
MFLGNLAFGERDMEARMMRSKPTRVALLVVACLLPGVTAQAATIPGEQVIVHSRSQGMSVSRDVNYADLDLTKPEDVERLKARTNRAAVQVCRDLNHRNPWAMTDLFGAHMPCVRNAEQQALAQVPGIVVSPRYRFVGEGD